MVKRIKCNNCKRIELELDLLIEAQAVAEKSKTWADLSNALFDPVDGLVTKAFPDIGERRTFRKSKTYDALHALVESKMEIYPSEMRM
jgi:hypothetical protein